MALDLTGIENVEFYSGHYLDAVLDSDLKGVFETWAQHETSTGHPASFKGLGAVSMAWHKARSAATGESDQVERFR